MGNKRLLAVVACVLLLLIAAGFFWKLRPDPEIPGETQNGKQARPDTSVQSVDVSGNHADPKSAAEIAKPVVEGNEETNDPATESDDGGSELAWGAIEKVIREHKLLASASPDAPKLAVVNQPSAKVVFSAPAVDERRVSGSPWQRAVFELPTAAVFGTVYVVSDEGLSPLAAAMVVDTEGRRAFTGPDGTFSLPAGLTESDADRVFLSVTCPGYKLVDVLHGTPVPFSSGASFYLKDCLSAPGAEFYLIPVEQEQVTVRIVEPSPVPPGMRIWAGWLGVGGKTEHYDLDYFVQGSADENGEVTFVAPEGLLGSHFGAFGPGYAGGMGDFQELETTEGRRVIALTVRPTVNFPVSGRITDLRSGLPVVNGRVYTRAAGEVTYTDEQGYFELYASKRWGLKTSDENPNYLQVCVWGSLGIAVRLDEDESKSFEAGGLARPTRIEDGGDWQIQLRPYVHVRGRVARADGSSVAGGRLDCRLSGALYEDRPLMSVEVAGDGTFEWEFLPWGIPSVPYSGTVNGRFGEERLAIDPVCWSSAEPVELELRLKD